MKRNGADAADCRAGKTHGPKTTHTQIYTQHHILVHISALTTDVHGVSVLCVFTCVTNIYLRDLLELGVGLAAFLCCLHRCLVVVNKSLVHPQLAGLEHRGEDTILTPWREEKEEEEDEEEENENDAVWKSTPK
jgi:hypothetical protein